MAEARSLWLAVRSVAWALLFPGFFAGYVPWRFFGLAQVEWAWASPPLLLGLACVGVGTGLLVTCIWEFARRGRGTLSPLDPPRQLVVHGPYRYVRNPMYVSVTLIVQGEVLLTGSRPLLVYWAAWFLAANVFVLGYEEPALRRQFGSSYEAYATSVGRWLPRFRRR